jgi:hypothetical protein
MGGYFQMIAGGELSHFGFFTGGVFLGIACGALISMAIFSLSL